ncbi:MAG: DUF2029 domain-containing protein [Candidatus Omnitrophota bacterium]|jgi:hypothetical protein|nr:MAG: DUF2029 domain-containing protein [Candidatus Omnitrophota bacterium]
MNTEIQSKVGLLLVLIAASLYGQSVWFSPYYAHRNDFTHLYIAGYLADHGRDFFDPQLSLIVKDRFHIDRGLNPFVYPPFFAILLIPLSRYGYDDAWTLFYCSSHLAFFFSLFILIRMIRDENEPSLFWWGLLLAISAIFSPLVQTFAAGQMNTFLLLIFTASLYQLKKQRELSAGALIGFGAAIKVAPAFFILYFLWKRKWAAAFSAVLVVLLSLLVSFLWLGPDVHYSFLDLAAQMGYGSSTWAEYGQHYHVEPHNQAPAALWYRLFTHNPSTTGVLDSLALAKLFSYVTALCIVVLLLYYTRKQTTAFPEWEYSIWIIGMLVIPSLMWDHYLTQALFPITVAVHMAIKKWERGIPLVGVAVAMMALPYLYQYPRWTDGWFSLFMALYFYDNPSFKQGWMTIFLSAKLCGLLLLFRCLLMNRPENESASDSEYLPDVFDRLKKRKSSVDYRNRNETHG